MRRIFKFSFSLFLLLLATKGQAQEADTVKADNSISVGFDVTGPALYAIDNSKYNFEAHLSYRMNYKYYLVIEPGMAKHSIDRYNYEYTSRAVFLRLGTDIGMLAPVRSKNNHFAGIGLRYGISIINQETPFIRIDNYWGQVNTSIPSNNVHAHFIELQGSVKAEIFKNVLIGWSIKLRSLIYSSGKNGMRPAYIPGMGTSDTFIAPAVAYYIIYRIPLGNS